MQAAQLNALQTYIAQICAYLAHQNTPQPVSVDHRPTTPPTCCLKWATPKYLSITLSPNKTYMKSKQVAQTLPSSLHPLALAIEIRMRLGLMTLQDYYYAKRDLDAE